MDTPWQGGGSEFSITIAGRSWTLKLDGPRPGLAATDGRFHVAVLGLRHVSTTARRHEEVFDGSSLESCEAHRNRVQATYAPRGLSGLIVRATWEPSPSRDGFDLEVQVSALGRRIFRRLEVAVESRWTASAGRDVPEMAYRVEPRDAASAALSYDGRDDPGVLQRLTTLPVTPAAPFILPPRIRRAPEGETVPSYVEMVAANEPARRIAIEPADPSADEPGLHWTRYGLFGHDLEKGVVLRGRIRGIWVDPSAGDEEVRRRHEAFLQEPPALGP